MYFCLGCLACETACPAGVDYAHLFEIARAEAESASPPSGWRRKIVRLVTLRSIFMSPRLLRFMGRLLRLYQSSGIHTWFHRVGLIRRLPFRWQELEKLMPDVARRFSCDLIDPVERPADVKWRVALLTGCVQDLIYSDINRDTADVLLANGCEVHAFPAQYCCGSLHAHNGDLESARRLARRQIDTFDPAQFNAIISNAAGCGSHLKHYDRLLENDIEYRERAGLWSERVRDISEWLVEIGFRKPECLPQQTKATYHEACHLCHGQGVTRQPREMLRSIPGLELTELKEATWCCGSAGVYNITQPEMSQKLQHRKVQHLRATGATVVATGNPGCLLQIDKGCQRSGLKIEVAHPVSLLASAYRRSPCKS
jgi:glycolate oxidase iron-sulfur subunit